MTDTLFSPFTLYDGLATFAILVGAMIAAGGGLGGGGVFVPIYILILNFSTKNAAALSQATIFGGSMVNLIMNMRACHPIRKHRPLTDFSTLLVFVPLLLVGTVIGVLLNVILPAMIILILLIVTLVYATFRTTNKGIEMWKTESETNQSLTRQHIAATQPLMRQHLTATQPSMNDDYTGYDTTESTAKDESDHCLMSLTDSALDAYDEKEALIKAMHKAEYGTATDNNGNKQYDELLWKAMATMCGVDISQLTPKRIEILLPLIDEEQQIWKPWFIISMVWIISSVTSIGKTEEITGVESCSVLYWIISFISFPVLFAISAYITKQQYYKYDAKDNSGGWLPADGDIVWNRSMLNMVKYPLIAMFAGLLGGLLGIGGGMIVSPLLMELGVLPTVAAATSAMAVLITSSSATLQFVLLGYLDLDYTFYFMAIGIIGTFIGQTVVNHCVQQFGRKSMIVFSVAAIMGGAVILMGIDGILQAVDGISWAFSAAC